MTGSGPTSQRPAPRPGDLDPSIEEGAAPSSSAVERLQRFTAANMVRSLLPLVVIVLLLAAWFNLGRDTEDPVQEVDPSSTVQLAAARADYAVLAPEGLAEEYRPTSARTDAGNAEEGDPVTLEIGYLTPAEEFAGFVVSDDAEAEPVARVLDGVEETGSVELGGQAWTRGTTTRGETVLFRQDGGVTTLVTGSAPDDELETVAAAVRPYTG
jgi:hypothetical protein